MDVSNALFWATGIDNSGLQSDKEKAVEIFKQLSSSVQKEANKIDKALDKLKTKGDFKFTNPVDPNMIASIKSQITELGVTIDKEIQKLSSFSYHYDQAMGKIKTSASKIGTLPASDPLGPTVERIKTRVSEADSQIGFLKRIFKRGVAYLTVYGSINWAENFAKQIVITKGQFDQLGVAINAFIGKASTSKALLQDVTGFAVKSPFSLIDITDSTRQLLAYGVQSRDVMHTLNLLSDVAAGSGQQIKDIAYLYGTAMTRGRVYSREMYQFATRGIPIWQALSGVMGVTTEKLQKMITKGQVGFKDLQSALESLAGAGGRYYGLSDKIAGTTYGRISNLEDKWKVMLNEIGTSNEGIINLGLEGTTALINNWEKVADTIKGAIAAVGAYKLSQIVISSSAKGGQIAYAGSYTKNALGSGLISDSWKRNASEAGLTEGSIAYQHALQKEMALQLAKAEVAVSTAKAEMVANKQLLASKEEEVGILQTEIATKTAERDIAIASGDAKSIETAQTGLNTAQESLNTAEKEKNTVSKELNVSATKVSTTEAKANNIQTAINTVEEKANTDSKKAGAAATALLGRAWKNLTAFMAANAVSLTIAGLTALIYVLYKLYQHVSENLDADKRWEKIQKEINEEEQKRVENANNLISIMYRENSSITQKVENFKKLKKEYPGLLKYMTLQNALSKSAAYWEEKIAEAEEGRTKRKLQNALVSAKQELDQAKSGVEIAQNQVKAPFGSPGFTGSPQQALASLAYAEAQYNSARKLLTNAQTAYKDYLDTEKKTVAATKNPTRNKDYWQNIANTERARREAMDDRLKGTKAWNDSMKKEAEAESHLKNFDRASTINKRGETAAEKAKREREARVQFLSQVKERKQQIDENLRQITDYQDNAEEIRQQAFTESMDKGYMHDSAVIKNEYDKKVKDIEKEQDKIVKLLQKNERLTWENQPKEKRSVFKPTISKWEDVPKEYKTGVQETKAAAEEQMLSKQKSLDDELLKQYDDYTQKKEEIDRKYYADRDALVSMMSRSKEGTEGYDTIALRIAQNEKMRILEQSKLAFEQLKSSPVYQLASEDTNKVSEEGLFRIISILKQYKQTAIDAYDPESIKTWTDEINKAEDRLIQINPAKVLKKAHDELITANKELAKSDVELANAQKEYNDAAREAEDLEARKSALTQKVAGISGWKGGVSFEGENDAKSENRLASARKELGTVTEKASNANKKLATATQNLTVAQNTHAIATSNVTNVTKTQVAATKKVLDTIGDLSKAISNVGGEMGGMAGQIVSLVGDIGTTVVGTINAFKGIDDMAAGAMKTIETASVILMAISAAIQIIQKVEALFEHESWAEKEYKRLTKLNKVLSETESLYEKLLSTASGEKAANVGKDYLENLKKQINTDYATAFVKNEEVIKNKTKRWLKWLTPLAYLLKDSTVAKKENSAIEKALGGDIWEKISKDLGKTIGSVTDINKLTADELTKLKEDFPELWSNLDENVQNAYNDIIEKNQEWEEAVKKVNEAITGISFDTLKDGMDDFLLSTDTSMSNVANNFEDYMRKSILNLVKTNYLSTALQGWYTDFANSLSDNKLSETEADNLKKHYEDIYTEAQKRVDDLLHLADISKTGTSSNTVKSSFSSMSEDQANVLTAQFSAIRINFSDLLNVTNDYINKFELMAQDVSQIRKYTALIADIKTIISDMASRGVKMI